MALSPFPCQLPASSRLTCAGIQSRSLSMVQVSDSKEECSELDLSMYPVPVTPIAAGGKDIEFERAEIAKAAMSSGPAITNDHVLFEDEWLLMVNKPCGVYSEHVLISVPTLQGLPYSSEYPMPNGEDFLHLANRLDRDTSGILIVTKCKAAAGKMTKIYKSRDLRKTYVALCAGRPPAWKSVRLESGHGKSRRGCWRVYRKQDVERELPGGSTVKDMATKITILNASSSSVDEQELTVEVGAEDGNGFESCMESNDGEANEIESREEVYIRAVPLTGRTHQIRLHCQYLGLPLIGDVKYGGPLQWKDEKFQSHCLHAETISFRHPMTDELLEVTAPLPQWANKEF